MNNNERIELIKQRLTQALNPELLTVEDESHHHVGHPGAASGAGHFAVKIISRTFLNQNLPTRHRLVYTALEDLMLKEIHALRIDANPPIE